MINWSAAPLVLNIKGNIKLDFGHGFNTPYRLGGDMPLVDINKFRINIRERYVKVTVENGTGDIVFQVGASIRSATKNDVSYNNFNGATLTVDSPGTYEIYY